ncbi:MULTISPECIES: helix-turn-helix transcriptional regulator [unclassified Microbulbifer]|uniref:helix-turn-helix transcriptional regulator n=1 Tax=unclassified Microbulbifer TaxID=2619833 RepID=UPI0027E52EB2|nr:MULTISPECIES: helix-turn-helix transcriptional regulator [unclassified Microbulbifer]
MDYREQAPRAELRPYINCFWAIDSAEPVTVRDRTLPDGCQEIIFNVETRVLRDDGHGLNTNPAVELVGQMTKPYQVVTSGRQRYFGIKFYPHSFSPFTRESICDLRDQSIDLRALFGGDFERIVDRVFERPAFERFVRLMENHLLHRLQSANTGSCYRLVERAVRRLFLPEPPTIDRLCAELGVSDRHLQSRFRRHTGLSPKQLAKMIRFQKSFQYLADPRISLTEVAQHCGYYDHAHFAHDFKSLAGVSPSQYLCTDRPLTGFFLAAESRAYLCNLR